VTLFLGAPLALAPPKVARVTTFMAAMVDMVEGGGSGEGEGWLGGNVRCA
jgi:hypothetical protein